MGQRLENAKRLYAEAIGDGRPREAIEQYSGARYVQHSTPVRDGKEGFVEFFDDFLQRNPVRDIQIVRGFEDGRYVFLHVVQDLNNGEFRYVTADIFDTDDDARMIEHWDIIEEMVDESASGRTQVDGPTEPADLDKTEANRAHVTAFLHEVLKSGDYGTLTSYINPDTYAQHNPQVADGLDGLATFVDALAQDGVSMVYREIHKVVACGSFVAALSHVDLGGTDMAVVDLFRVEGGLIVEHWDVMEEITPRDTWVNSGKF